MTSSHAILPPVSDPQFRAEAWDRIWTDAERPIDLVQLSRQTIGDKRLEAELLRLFVRQAEQIQRTLDAATGETRDSPSSLELMHMLSGSARAIGAKRIVVLATRFESELRVREKADLSDADRALLREAIGETNRYIGDLLDHGC